jgi:DNA-directed RNA polymerase specialized sigma24 family protein
MSDDFAYLYETHVADVYAYFTYRFGSRAAAEALTQATFERAFEQRAGFDYDPPRARSSLLTIARDTSAGVTAPERDDDGPGIDPDLAGALDQLGREERTVIALRFGARLDRPQIARVLDTSERRVRRVLSRGLRRLRTELEGQRRPATPGEQSAPAGGAGGD